MCPAEGHGHPVLSVLQGRAQGSSEPGFWLSDLAQVLTSLANGDHGPWSSDSGKGAQHRKHTQTGSETFSGLLKITAFGAEPKTAVWTVFTIWSQATGRRWANTDSPVLGAELEQPGHTWVSASAESQRGLWVGSMVGPALCPLREPGALSPPGVPAPHVPSSCILGRGCSQLSQLPRPKEPRGWAFILPAPQGGILREPMVVQSALGSPLL